MSHIFDCTGTTLSFNRLLYKNLVKPVPSFDRIINPSESDDRHQLHTSGINLKKLYLLLADEKDREMAKIKEKLFETFYVRIDEVRQGSGTSMNGNIARKCLKDTSTLATVLGLNEEFVKRLSFVLLAFKRKKELNLDNLDRYCRETYKLFFDLYPWAKMNPSVHKMLRHGVDIARKFPLSLAYFAEDAAESMHKCYRNTSLHHARQNSRENRLKDVFNRAVDKSDPLISLVYLDKRRKAQSEELPDEFLSLFDVSDTDEE